MDAERPVDIAWTYMSSETDATRRRPYQKRRRAEREVEVRDRITEAAVTLHGTLGPARTTIKGIATEAGVQRATVYRYFPDLDSIFIACSTRWANRNPPPDPATWSKIADPGLRLRQGLGELYAWYEWAEPMLTKVFRDAPNVPAMTQPIEDFQRHFEALHQALLAGRKHRGRPRTRASAAIGHALAFATWRSFVCEHSLSSEETVELMCLLVASASSPRQSSAS